MKKLKLRKYVMPSVVIAISCVSVLAAALLIPTSENVLSKLNYVSNTIISQEKAVINTTQKVIYPYTDQSVQVGKSYYDYKSTAEEQENSLHYYENTYIQNSGIDFVYEEKFNVVSILEGTVTNVKEDSVLGNIVEVTHSNDYISVYQSLSEIKVSKGDVISQGQVIGVSGTNEIDKDLGNHLHFEMYIGGYNVNPTNYLDKEINKKNN